MGCSSSKVAPHCAKQSRHATRYIDDVVKDHDVSITSSFIIRDEAEAPKRDVFSAKPSSRETPDIRDKSKDSTQASHVNQLDYYLNNACKPDVCCECIASPIFDDCMAMPDFAANTSVTLPNTPQTHYANDRDRRECASMLLLPTLTQTYRITGDLSPSRVASTHTISPPKSSRTVSSSTPRVCIVDDSAVYRKQLTRYLRNIATDVTLFSDGSEMLQVAKAQPSNYQQHIFLLDFDMPQCNGASTVRQLREMGIDAPMIVVTSNTDVTQECLAAGADQVLPKPLRRDELLSALAMHVSSAALSVSNAC